MARDEEAFTEFVTTRSVALLRTAYLLTGDRQLAEDLLRTSLIRAFTLWGRVREPRAAEAEVRRAMVRTLTSRWTRPVWARQRIVEEPLESPLESTVEPAGEDGEPPTRLWPVVLTLPPQQRAVIVLRYHDDLTEGETATILGGSTGAVQSDEIRARQTLQDEAGPTASLEDRLRTELSQAASGLEFRADFAMSGVGSTLARRRLRRRRLVTTAVAIVAVLGAATVTIGTGSGDGSEKPDVDPPISPTPPAPAQLDPSEIQHPPAPGDVGVLPWRDTALPRVLPVDVASAPPLSENPIDHALALVAGDAADVGVVGDDGRLRRLDGVELEPPDPDLPSSNPVDRGSLTPDGRLAALLQPGAVVVVDLATGDSERFDLPGTITRVIWHPDQRHILVSREDGSSDLLDTEAHSIVGEPFSADRAAFMPDGTPLEIRETGDWPARSDLITWGDDGVGEGVPILLRHMSETPASATERYLVVAATYEDPDAARASGETGWVVVDVDSGAPLWMLRAPTAWYNTWLFGLHGWLGEDTVLIQTADHIVAWTPALRSLERVTEVSGEVSLATAAIE